MLARVISLSSWGGGTISRSLNKVLMTNSGTTRLISEARKAPLMIATGVICPPIQSIVVVTSPIADQAPPALAAITIIAAKNKRSLWLPNSFLISEIITIVVVKLSSTALRKKVRKPTSHIKVTCLLVRISEAITSKPLWASITSTIVMAPIRKNTIWAVEDS